MKTPPPVWVLKIKEVSRLLRVPVSTVYKMAQSGRLPGAFKAFKHWRIKEAEFMAWIQGKTRTKEDAIHRPLRRIR